MSPNHADVTAVVLNYARLENVKVIVAHLCNQKLRDTISNVIIWNNKAGLVLSDAEFASASPPLGMLRIVNSSENLYFQARFLACVNAPTHLCFVQDDDYLVSAEAIRALRQYSRLNQAQGHEYPIHLLPLHEHLSTTIRTRTAEKSVASFAWLGHGTLLTKKHAQSFLDLLRTMSDGRDDVMKMADNFFSILLNRRAEIWVDPGKPFETGKEAAFTVGVEGEERNWRYMKLAEEYLERVISRPELQSENRFSVLLGNSLPNTYLVTRAPVLAPGYIGVWSTNVPMLPSGIPEVGLAAKDLRAIDTLRRSAMSDRDILHYVQHSLACIGDGLTSTVFQSPGACQTGQWIQFDFLEEKTAPILTFKWTVEPVFTPEIGQMSYDILEKGQEWIRHDSILVVDSEPAGGGEFLVRLELDRPSSLVAVRAIVGAGSHKRPPWQRLLSLTSMVMASNMRGVLVLNHDAAGHDVTPGRVFVEN